MKLKSWVGVGEMQLVREIGAQRSLEEEVLGRRGAWKKRCLEEEVLGRRGGEEEVLGRRGGEEEVGTGREARPT